MPKLSLFQKTLNNLRQNILIFKINVGINNYNILFKHMMNLSITGKKMNTPVPTKKTNDISSPVKPQPKVIPKKTNQIKLNQNQTYKNTQTKKQEVLKIESKKQAQKKVQEKIEKKQQAPPKIQEKTKKQLIIEQPKVEVKKQEVISKVTVRYNHYKEQFPTVNGILFFKPIEQKYSFADVFRGKYLPVLKIFKENDQIIPETTGFAIEYSWKVQQGLQYKLEIRQDEEQQLKVQKKAYKAPQKDTGIKKNARFEELTEQMKKLDPSELNGALHKQLLEQRDLQDVLFS